MSDLEASAAAQPGVPDLAFEKIDRTGTGGAEAGYGVVLLMLIGGVAVLLGGSGKLAVGAGIGMIAFAIFMYIHLFRTAPRVRYFRYFWLDQYGIHHIEGGSPSDRTAHFAWHEIATVEAAPRHDEFQGLILTLHRKGLRGVPLYLWMGGAEQAAAAINDYLARNGGRPDRDQPNSASMPSR